MSFDKWDMSFNPSEKDKNRWRIKLKIDEDGLAAFMQELPGTQGRPFLLENEEFDFGFYIYDIKDEDIHSIKVRLENRCNNGSFTGPGREQSLDAMLDRVAQGLDSIIAPGSSAEPAPPSATVEPSPHETPAPVPSAAPAYAPQIYKDEIPLNSGYTFQEFVIGPNNRFTAAAAQAVADNPGKIYNPFFIYGGVGLGKTHLMNAVGHYVRQKNPGLVIQYVTTEKFMSEVIDSVRKGALQQMRDRYRQADLLLVDDIQFLVESESTQEEFFHTFNILHQNGKQIIITSDRPPKQLTTLEDRLRSRFEWGLIADIKSPNLETRVAILKKKGENDHLLLDDNILLFIASKLKSNIRELEGFLKRINAYATLTHQEVNMELIRSVMDDLLPQEEQEKPISVQAADVPSRPAAPQPPAVVTTDFQPPPPPVLKPVAETPPAPPAAESPLPPPMPPKLPAPAAVPSEQRSNETGDSGLKPVEVAFLYPEGHEAQLVTVKERFTEVIRKHKLKFSLESVFERPYDTAGKLNYTFFPELCKSSGVSIAVILGPPPEAGLDPEEFGNILTTVMDDEKLSLQLVPWTELNKDYRYLNLALDITLLRHRT